MTTIKTTTPARFTGGVDLRSKDLAKNLRGSGVTVSQLSKYDDSGNKGNNNGVLEGPELARALAAIGKTKNVKQDKLQQALRNSAGVAPQPELRDSPQIREQKKRIAKLKGDVKAMEDQESYYCAPRKDPYSCGAAEKMTVDAQVALGKAQRDLTFWKRPLQKHSIYHRNGRREDRFYSSPEEGNRLLRTRKYDKKGKLIADIIPKRLRFEGGSISQVHNKDGSTIRVDRNEQGEALKRTVRDANGRSRVYNFYPGAPPQKGIRLGPIKG